MKTKRSAEKMMADLHKLWQDIRDSEEETQARVAELCADVHLLAVHNVRRGSGHPVPDPELAFTDVTDTLLKTILSDYGEEVIDSKECEENGCRW